MAFDGLTIRAIVNELEKKLTGSKIDKISQAERDEILLTCRGKGQTYRLLISASPSFPRIYIASEYKKDNPLQAPNFLMILRKYIQGGRILSIVQDGFDRVLYIDIHTYDDLRTEKIRRLVVEIMGRHSNIILVDKESNTILDSAKRIPLTISSYREVLPSMEYKSPPSQEKLNPISQITIENFIKLTYQKYPIFKSLYMLFSGLSPLIAKEICYRSGIDPQTPSRQLTAIEIERVYNSFTRLMQEIKNLNFEPCIVLDQKYFTIDFSCIYLSMYENYNILQKDDISVVCEEYYNTRDTKDRLKQKSHDIRKILKNKISALEHKIEKQVQEINETVTSQEYKKEADLLTAYIYKMEKGMEQIEVENFYSQNQEKVQIKLDVNLTPSENIQKRYKKYNKMKSRKKELTIQIENAKEELNYLYNLEISLDNISNTEDLEDIEAEMKQEGLIKNRNTGKKKRKLESTFNPMEFISEDGYLIYVGKNNKQNDYLTLKFAKTEDMWLHTKNIPGSHAVIKNKKGEVSDMAIHQAAIICAFYSKAKFSQGVPVDYTQRKNVKKPNSAKPGMVIYDSNSTVYVTPDENLVEKLRVRKNIL